MTLEIQFYHLLSTPLEQALPKLMAKAYERGMTAQVFGEKETLETLDKAMWTFNPASFIPHGTWLDPYPDKQPILLNTTLAPLNKSRFLVITNGHELTEEEQEDHEFERIFDIFDGTDDEKVQEARTRWKHYKDRGWRLNYVRQSEDGSWSKKSE
jgi:DNA polymerase-3 subunit chi